MRILTLAAVLVLAACGDREEAANSDAITVTGQAQTRAPIGPAPAEKRGQEFVSTVLGSYDFAQRAAQHAVERGNRPEVKAAAQKLTRDLAASLDEMKAIATRSKLMLAPTPVATAQTDLAVLSSTRGEPLDRAYTELQMETLTLLVGLLRAYKNGGDNDELKAWANKAQAIVNEHLLDTQTLKAVVEEAAEPT